MAAPIRSSDRRTRPLVVERATALRDLPLDGVGALYGQIYRAIREAILDGRVTAGTRLPTTRALAEELGVSRNTVVSAFDPLRSEGYVVSRVGAGTFVAPQVGSQATRGSAEARPSRARRGARHHEARRGEAAPVLSRFGKAVGRGRPRDVYDAVFDSPPVPFDFLPCVPDLERLPYEEWRRHLVRTAHHAAPGRFDYADPAGVPELRAAISDYLGRARGVLCEADEIVVVGGVAQALDLATRLFIDPGDSVLVEDPHYLGARRSFEAGGAELVGGPVDDFGIDVTKVSSEARKRCRLAYVTPSHQYPTGAILSLARRQELLAWAGEANAYILEDDYDSEFRYRGRAIPSLKSLDHSGRVLYVGTFSKTLLPSLRIAYLVLPKSLVSVFRSAKWLADWAAPSFEQIALSEFLASGDFERHLRRARTLYARSRDALVEAIDRDLSPFGPSFRDSQAGLHLLLRLDSVPQSKTRAVLVAAREKGLGLYPAAPCYLDRDPARPLELVMGFARLEPEAVAGGVSKLGEVLEEIDTGR